MADIPNFSIPQVLADAAWHTPPAIQGQLPAESFALAPGDAGGYLRKVGDAASGSVTLFWAPESALSGDWDPFKDVPSISKWIELPA